jgi:hypothetical protein
MAAFYDLKPEGNRFFPRHGWIAGLTGVRMVRLPVMRLYQWGGHTHEFFLKNEVAGIWLQSKSPYRTLRQMAICFRELHQEIRDIEPLHKFRMGGEKGDKERDLALTRLTEGEERTEVLLISAFILLRRLADELINASRPFLFEHWKSAPREMKTAVSFARDGKLKQLHPICVFDVLAEALITHTAWLDRLRDVNGIRDILVHKPHILQVSAFGTQNADESSIKWRSTANLTTVSNLGEITTQNLFDCLFECLDGACKFMELLCVSVGLDDGYQRGDWIMLSGKDNDTVAFWPPIEGSRTEFPLLS